MTVPATDDKEKATNPPAPGATKPDEQGGKTVPLPELLKEREKRQSIEAERDSLKQTLAYVQQQSQMRQPGFQPGFQQGFQQPIHQPMNPAAQEMQRLWETDTQKAVQAEIMMAMSWFDGVNQAVDQQENFVAGKYADFGNYRDQVRTYLRTIPLNQRTQPGVVEAAYYFVKGQQVDNIIKSSQEEIIRKIRAGEAIQGFDAGAGTPPPPQAKALSDEQKRVAAAMGLTPEQYQKNMK
jgi:hypothetical protein